MYTKIIYGKGLDKNGDSRRHLSCFVLYCLILSYLILSCLGGRFCRGGSVPDFILYCEAPLTVWFSGAFLNDFFD